MSKSRLPVTTGMLTRLSTMFVPEVIPAFRVDVFLAFINLAPVHSTSATGTENDQQQ